MVNVGYANTTDNKKKTNGQEQEQESRRKSDQTMIRPDGETAAEPIDQDLEEESENIPSQSSRTVYSPIDKADSVKADESVSKYNFIFYFLYKFKYDGEESP